MDNVIHAKKSFLQKISKISGIISFVIAIVGMLFILVIGSDLGDVYKASAGATTFFFFMVGLVLTTMGNTNLPDLKISSTSKD